MPRVLRSSHSRVSSTTFAPNNRYDERERHEDAKRKEDVSLVERKLGLSLRSEDETFTCSRFFEILVGWHRVATRSKR